MDDLKTRLETALRAADEHTCAWGEVPPYGAMTGAVLAVRDEELERQLRRRDFARKRAEQAEAAIARVRAVLGRYDWETAGDRIPGPDIIAALDGGA